MAGLQSLSLYQIQDSDLALLTGLRDLRELEIRLNPIGQAGLKHLAEMEELEKLDLWGIEGVTDDTLVSIKGLTHLRSLDLAGTMITNQGLAHLKRLKQLEELNLGLTLVTEEGLAELRGLQALRTLNLNMTDVSDEGVSKLIEVIPGLKVSHRSNDVLLSSLREERELLREFESLRANMGTRRAPATQTPGSR